MQNITPQAKAIYRLLSSGKSLTAAEISSRLNIFPNAVYRGAKVLEKFGFVRKVGRYPIVFFALHPATPLGLYAKVVKDSLAESFSQTTLPKTATNLDVSFINNRAELLEKTNIDFENCEKEACLIVSGLEVPAETMLEYKKSIDRGVRVRIVVQNLDEVRKEMLSNWQKMGIEVRHYPLIEARIFVFDAKVAYISSYNPNLQEEGLGVRFNYPPVAAIMSDLFEQRWEEAKEIK